MGGNQAMRDAADMLKQLLPLAQLASSGAPVEDLDVQRAVQAYEDDMIPRAFDWVQKSEGLGRKVGIPNYSSVVVRWMYNKMPFSSPIQRVYRDVSHCSFLE
jgi:hypothetical protein